MSAPDAAVDAAANELHDREGYSIALADGPAYRKAYYRTLAREVLEAAAPHIISEHLLKLAADVRARGDIGKDGGLESWDYLTWHAERALTAD